MDRVPAIPLGRPVVCPIFVGREAHVQTLERILDRVRSGTGEVVLVAGEAGIGKSRLVREAQLCASRLDFVVLEGHCFETDRAHPYAPFLDLLRPCSVPQWSERLGQGHTTPPILATLPAELASLVTAIDEAASVEPEQEKRRLFRALADFTTALSAVRPVLVLIEDLHWSDDTSLEFLLYLTRRLPSHPVLLLCTYRSDEVQPSLRSFLAELDRGRQAVELALPRLARPHVETMVRAICALNEPVRPRLIDVVFTLTEGNPFFVEEVLKSLMSGDERWHEKPIGELPVPRSVQDAVVRRTARLPPAAHQALRLAAVVGRRFDFALLQGLTGQSELALLNMMKVLIAAQLVAEESADGFSFRHALTRHTIYARLLARERKALHRLVAVTLERVHADVLDRYRADLAYHYYEAEAWEQALANAQRAGEQAQNLYAPRAAIEHFTRALDAATHLSVSPPAQLHQGRARAYKTLGEFELARTDLEAALALSQAAGDSHTEWQTLLDLGLLWASRDYDHTGEHYREALRLARGMKDQAMLARSLNRMGNWHLNVEQPLVALRYHEEALGIFEELTDRRGIAETLDLLGMARCCCGDLLGSIVVYERAATLLRELDERSTLVLSLALLSARAGDGHFDPLVPAFSEFARARTAGIEAMALARQIEWRAGEAFACAEYAQCLATRGEYGRALETAQRACRTAAEIGHGQWLAFANEVLGQLYLDLLALPVARRHLEQALLLAREVGSLIWVNAASGALIATCVQQGDVARAEAVLAEAPSLVGPPQSFAQRVLACAVLELALARGEPQRALQCAELVHASIEPADSDGRRRVGPPQLGRLRAEALAALGRRAEAESILKTQLEAARARSCLPLLWRLHAALGRGYRVGGRHIEAEREFAAGRAIVEQVAADVPDEYIAGLAGGSLRQHFVRAASARLTAADPPLAGGAARRGPDRLTRHGPDGLTHREIEVLRLLAAGRSNRELADELVISVRTVEHHIANIYRKTGARRRAAATTYALRHRLLPADEADR